jgi:4-hydroxybenzoate polyprenyltransferase
LSSVLKLRAWRLAVSGPIFFTYFPLIYLELLKGDAVSAEKTLFVLLAITFYFANGFLINDLADRAKDQAAGIKSESRGHSLSKSQMLALIVATGGVSIALAVAVQGNWAFYLLWVISFLMSVIYSVPPMALKRRGLSGAICDSLIERPLPILIVFTFFSYYGFEIVAIPILSELSWSVFKHQIADYDKDSVSGVRTLAVRLGRERSLALLRWFLNPVGVMSQILLFTIAWFEIVSLRALLDVLIALYVVGVAATSLAQSRIHFRTTPTDPPYVMFSNFAYKFLALPSLTIFLISRQPELFFLGVALVVSLIPQVRDYYRFVPVFLAGVRTPSGGSKP